MNEAPRIRRSVLRKHRQGSGLPGLTLAAILVLTSTALHAMDGKNNPPPKKPQPKISAPVSASSSSNTAGQPALAKAQRTTPQQEQLLRDGDVPEKDRTKLAQALNRRGAALLKLENLQQALDKSSDLSQIKRIGKLLDAAQKEFSAADDYAKRRTTKAESGKAAVLAARKEIGNRIAATTGVPAGVRPVYASTAAVASSTSSASTADTRNNPVAAPASAAANPYDSVTSVLDPGAIAGRPAGLPAGIIPAAAPPTARRVLAPAASAAVAAAEDATPGSPRRAVAAAAGEYGNLSTLPDLAPDNQIAPATAAAAAPAAATIQQNPQTYGQLRLAPAPPQAGAPVAAAAQAQQTTANLRQVPQTAAAQVVPAAQSPYARGAPAAVRRQLQTQQQGGQQP